MKKVMKKAIALVATVVMVFSLAGCGAISYDDITGDWTTKSVDGKSIDEYAQSLGVDKSQVATNMTIKDDDTIECSSATVTEKYTYERKSNGFEVKKEGSDEIFMSVTYNESDKTLSYQVNPGTGVVTIVLEKGKADFTAPATTEGATDQAQ